MKKITRIFTLIIALLFTVSAVDASPLSALGRSRLKAEALQSLNNLKQLGTAATMCALDGELPKENGAAGLQKFRENGSITPQLLIAAYDKTSRAAAGSAKIAEENTSYAYRSRSCGPTIRFPSVMRTVQLKPSSLQNAPAPPPSPNCRRKVPIPAIRSGTGSKRPPPPSTRV